MQTLENAQRNRCRRTMESKKEYNSNITSPEWHPELVMWCDPKVMNAAFSSSLVCVCGARADEKWICDPFFCIRFEQWKRVLFSASCFFLLLCRSFFLVLTSIPMLEVVMRKRACAWGRYWMSNWTRRRINSLALFFGLSFLKSFERFSFHVFESENSAL